MSRATPLEMQGLHDALTAKALTLMKGKQADYGKEGDCLANFRLAENLGVDPRFGVLLRMMDKMSRLSTSVTKGLANESRTDSILDIINYAVIFEALSREKDG
jgi:hypothetical protein